jgi:hypothetical protein
MGIRLGMEHGTGMGMEQGTGMGTGLGMGLGLDLGLGLGLRGGVGMGLGDPLRRSSSWGGEVQRREWVGDAIDIPLDKGYKPPGMDEIFNAVSMRDFRHHENSAELSVAVLE